VGCEKSADAADTAQQVFRHNIEISTVFA